ncbi:MAG TPA: LLM class flavin-dependent oxidoreductase, partial [Rubrobacter sp.]|nr:LLM class flavin-dependent oxidoreductase [Rubrobacter sp.]
MKFSYEMLPEQPVPTLLEIVELIDRLGFHACYSADETYHKDMWQIFAVAATRTNNVRLAPDVTHVIIKDPTVIAQQVATLDELSGGRAEAAFSIGNIAMLEQYHVDWKGTRPMARLREAHRVMRTFLDEGAIDFEGEFYNYTGLFTAARPVQERVPLKIGAMGVPKSFELAGEMADGLHVACAYSLEALGYAAEHFRAGAQRAGRDWSSLDLGANVLTAIGTDSGAAKEAARVMVAFYIPSMPSRLIERHGIDYESVRPIVEAVGSGDVGRALELTSPEVGEKLSIAG